MHNIHFISDIIYASQKKYAITLNIQAYKKKKKQEKMVCICKEMLL